MEGDIAIVKRCGTCPLSLAPLVRMTATARPPPAVQPTSLLAASTRNSEYDWRFGGGAASLSPLSTISLFLPPQFFGRVSSRRIGLCQRLDEFRSHEGLGSLSLSLSRGAHKNRGRSQMCCFLQQGKCGISVLYQAGASLELCSERCPPTPASSISSFVGHEDEEEPLLGPFLSRLRLQLTCITYSENVLPAISDSPRPLSLSLNCTIC